MARLQRVADRTFGRHLESGEEVIAAAEATSAGSGAQTLMGAGVGALCGALAWTLLDMAALWPLAMLGGFGGIIGGAGVAARTARAASGPGATVVRLVLTDRRLLTLRQRSAIRFAPLRSYRLEDIAEVESSATELGRYRRVTVTLRSGDTMQLLVAGPHDFGRLWEEQRPTPDDPSASEDEPTG